MSHSDVWHGACIRATRRIHICDLPYWYVRHDSHLWFALLICETWLIHTCDMAVNLLAIRCHIKCNRLQQTATDCDRLQQTATDCNRLQQTTTDCNRLQQTATDCNRLQQTATANKIACHQTSYPVTVFGTSRAATDATDCNGLQQTATHCNTLILQTKYLFSLLAIRRHMHDSFMCVTWRIHMPHSFVTQDSFRFILTCDIWKSFFGPTVRPQLVLRFKL